jgi:2-polyprenyl-3-methyl-5-hydroxy-6-metoxy-1,4-benzoquinol methylase
MRTYRKAALLEAIVARRDDDEEQQVATVQHYGCSVNRLDKKLALKFVQLHRDAEANAFIESCREWAHSGEAVWKDLLGSCMRSFCSITTTNAMLRIGSMHVLSSQQIQTLLGSGTGGRLLDVGAGDGNVTMKYRPFFQDIITTEVNSAMAKRLREKGFPCVETSQVTREALALGLQAIPMHCTDPHELNEHLSFDVVSCLNVLDRCPTPKTLLRQIKDILRPETGLLLLAVVLPFCPFVENGPAWSQADPDEILPIHASRWENAVQELVDKVFSPLGFEVKSLSRVPYLCCGITSNQPVLQLDDAIFVLSPVSL